MQVLLACEALHEEELCLIFFFLFLFLSFFLFFFCWISFYLFLFLTFFFLWGLFRLMFSFGLRDLLFRLILYLFSPLDLPLILFRWPLFWASPNLVERSFRFDVPGNFNPLTSKQMVFIFITNRGALKKSKFSKEISKWCVFVVFIKNFCFKPLF